MLANNLCIQFVYNLIEYIIPSLISKMDEPQSSNQDFLKAFFAPFHSLFRGHLVR